VWFLSGNSCDPADKPQWYHQIQNCYTTQTDHLILNDLGITERTCHLKTRDMSISVVLHPHPDADAYPLSAPNYWLIIRKLIFLAQSTHPKISYVVNSCAHYLNSPIWAHYQAAQLWAKLHTKDIQQYFTKKQQPHKINSTAKNLLQLP